MRLLLLLALPHALALRTAGAGAAGSRPTEASKATVLVEGVMQRQERLREFNRAYLTLHPHPHPHPNPNPNPNPSPALSLRQERLRECTRCWLPLDLCLCADGRIQTGVTSRV